MQSDVYLSRALVGNIGKFAGSPSQGSLCSHAKPWRQFTPAFGGCPRMTEFGMLTRWAQVVAYPSRCA